MAFTLSQLQAIKAAIVADNGLNAFPNNSDGNYAIAIALNSTNSPEVLFWDTRCQTSVLLDAIDFSKYTQVDAVDGTAVQTNRLLAVQTKQMNIQTLMFGREFVDMSKATIRSSIRDGVIAIPSGTGGASVAAAGANGVNVLSAGRRPGSRLEVILTSGTATTGGVTGNLFGYEGAINYQEVAAARDS